MIDLVDWIAAKQNIQRCRFAKTIRARDRASFGARSCVGCAESNVRSRQEFISWTLLAADAFASVRRASAILVDETPAASILQSLASALRRDQAYCHRFFFFFAIRRPKPPISSLSINSIPACSNAAWIR